MAPEPRRQRTLRTSAGALLTVLAAGVGLLGQSLLNNRLVFPVALGLALTAGMVAIVSARTAPSTSPMADRRVSRLEIGLVIGLLAFAFLIRVWQNGEFPIGVTYDEATNGVEATGLMHNPTFPIWSDALSGRPTVHLHLLAVAFALLGPTPEVLRGVSALIGALTLIPVYLLGRYVGGVPLGLAAMSFLALSRWGIGYSRLGYEAIFGPLCAACAIYFFMRAWSERKTLFFALCGVSLAAGLYTYVAFRLFPFAIAAMALVALVRDWRTGGIRPALWTARGLVVAMVTLLLVTAPLLNFARTDWTRFSHRFQEVSVFNEIRTKNSIEPLVENTLRHIGMFNYRGGIRAATNLPFLDAWQPGYPMLGIPFAAFFLIGFFRGLRRLGTPLGMGMFAALVTSLTAGALTVTMETPHQTRAFIALVPATFYAGEGLIATAQSLATLLSAMPAGTGGWGRAALGRNGRSVVGAFPTTALAFTCLVLLATGLSEGEMYRRQLAHPEAWWDFDGSTNRAARLIRALPPDTRIIVSATLKQFPSDNIVRFVSGRDMSSLKALDTATDLPARDASKPVAYVITPVDYPIVAAGFRAAYPDSRPTEVRDPFDRIQAIEYDLSIAHLAAATGLRRQRFSGAACDGQVIDSVTEPGPRFGQEPQSTRVACERWSGAMVVPKTGSYRLVFTGGPLAATLDGAPLDDRPQDIVAGFAELSVQRPSNPAVTFMEPWTLRLAPVGDGPDEPAVLFARTEMSRGLVGTYFPNPSFTGDPVAVRRDWSLLPVPLAPGPFSIIWQGFLTTPTEGRYTFAIVGDDAAQLSIDGALLLDVSVASGKAADQREVQLSAGKHPIEVRFRNADGGQSFELDWIPPGASVKERVPLSALSPY